MLVARGCGGGGVGGEAAGRLVVRVGVGVEVQLAAVQVVHALVRARRVGRVRGGDLIRQMRNFRNCLLGKTSHFDRNVYHQFRSLKRRYISHLHSNADLPRLAGRSPS